jgi:hypothetical protein
LYNGFINFTGYQMKKSIVTALVLAVLVAGCSKGPEEVSGFNETVTLTLTGFKPPKRAYATFTDSNGQVYQDIYVSKRCSNWKTKALVGKEFEVNRTRITYSDGSTRYRHNNLKELFCG